MKKLLVLALSACMLLAFPMAVGATAVDPSPDQAYDGGDSTDTEIIEEDGDGSGDTTKDPDQAYDDGGSTTTTTTEEDDYDPTKSPKTGDTSAAGAAAVVVIAGGCAFFAGRKLKRA